VGPRTDLDVFEKRHTSIPARIRSPIWHASSLATVSTTLSPGLHSERLKLNDRTECWPDDQNQQMTLIDQHVLHCYAICFNNLI